MSDENKKDETKVQADDDGIAIGNLSIGGSVHGTIIFGNNNTVTNGYTAEEVAAQIAQIRSTFQAKPFDGRCPYKGLDVFEEEDAELFFGREKLVDDLVSRVKESRTVFVTGPSGSGKSSLVRAGLIHALKQGTIKGSERWLYATMKPGRDPLESLATAFSRLKSPELGNYFRKNVSKVKVLDECAESALTDNKNQRLVLFIDQFEEVFTQISKEKEEDRVAFLNLLTHAATIENGRVIILFSMRSDFVSNCATYPQLNALLNQQFVQIGAMQPEELVSAIAQPALRVGLRIDPDLIAQIINEMKGEPGALPLMQFALKDLFDSQHEKSGVPALILNDYLQRGGIHKALERHADDSFSKLSKNEQELARSIFSGLIEIGRGAQDTKRTALFDELVPANTKAAEVEAIVQKLADARLITTDEAAGKDTVTISHEKLIDAWPWLRKLVNENRDRIALENQIKSDAKDWDIHQRDASYLYTGSRLGIAQEQLDLQKVTLNDLAINFINEAVFNREKDIRSKELLRKRINAGLISGIMIALILAGFAIYQMLQAQKQAQISRAGELAAQARQLFDSNFPAALLLGIESFRTFDIPRTRGILLDTTTAHPEIIQFLNGHSDFVTSVAFSPDGKTLASGSWDNTIILWDIATRQPIGQPLNGHSSFVLSVAFSPDGKTLASGSYDNTIILWDIATRQPIGQPLRGHLDAVTSMAFSPDGKTLASGSADNTIILWDVATRQPIGQPLSRHLDAVLSVAFSPDGKTLASGSYDNTIILWDIATRQPIGQPLSGHLDAVLSVAFSPDGKTLASGSTDNAIILWDVSAALNTSAARRSPFGQPLSGNSDAVTSMAFSPDGKTLALGNLDKTVILWDLAVRSPIGQPFSGHLNSVTSVTFSPDGKTLASSNYGFISIILWDVATRQPIGQPFSGVIDIVTSVAFSPDGKTLASGIDDNTIILWEVA